jgi:hypothetical protein
MQRVTILKEIIEFYNIPDEVSTQEELDKFLETNTASVSKVQSLRVLSARHITPDPIVEVIPIKKTRIKKK